jgi:hypothetical protein
VLQADRAKVVARPERPIGLDQVFRDHEQRDASAACRRPGKPREHQVDDVLGELVVAPGDVDLGPGDAVLAGMLAIGDGLGGGAERADIAARLRLGEVHRARPGAADELGQVHRLLGRASVMRERLDRPH